MALYGNTKVERIFCDECQSYTFVKGGKKVCCGDPVDEIPAEYKRMSDAEPRRRTPSAREQRRIMEEQECRCIYCGVKFGEFVTRKDKHVLVKVNWDHRLPFSLTLDNRHKNFVAACSICNGIKSDKFFETLAGAQAYIQKVREKKGYIVE